MSLVPMINDLLTPASPESAQRDVNGYPVLTMRACLRCGNPEYLEWIYSDRGLILCDRCPDVAQEASVKLLDAAEMRWPSLSPEELRLRIAEFLEVILALRRAAKTGDQPEVQRAFAAVLGELEALEESAKAFRRSGRWRPWKP